MQLQTKSLTEKVATNQNGFRTSVSSSVQWWEAIKLYKQTLMGCQPNTWQRIRNR